MSLPHRHPNKADRTITPFANRPVLTAHRDSASADKELRRGERGVRPALQVEGVERGGARGLDCGLEGLQWNSTCADVKQNITTTTMVFLKIAKSI